MNVESENELSTHIKCGASWEGFALEQVIRHREARPEECYFWGGHEQGEVDLLIQGKKEQEAFEFKYSSAPELTKLMQLAVNTLPIKSLTVVAPVEAEFPLSENVIVKPIRSFS